ncbi:MAG: hypothetical protein KC635_11695, partial [Myxococcales bacterium]|nr:hypothetical protein [Myxococcales bacterium]
MTDSTSALGLASAAVHQGREGRRTSLFGRGALAGAVALAVLSTGVGAAWAQPAPPDGTPVPRPSVPPVIKPGAKDPRTPALRRGDALPVATTPDGVVRTEGGQPGVIDTGDGGDTKTFDPGAPGGDAATPGATPDDSTKVEDVIEWKTNFEQGIKCKKIPLNARIRLDFNEVSLGDLTKFISCVTEQNFILTGGVNRAATVSILSPKPVTAYEAYKAYLSALEANGLTVVPNGNFLEIVPSGESKTSGGPIYGPRSSGPNTDQIVTRLIQLDHVPAEEILPVLDKFKTKSADITHYAPTNTLIITDTGSNIRRLLKLIKEIDVPIGKSRIWIRPIINTSAAEIVTLLQQIMGDSGSSGGGGGAAAASPAAARRANFPYTLNSRSSS